MTALMSKKRVYLKCSGCLSTYVIEKGDESVHLAPCPICNSNLDVMGTVKDRNYGRATTECPCDERCTDAPGANCSCKCGGVYHGTGLVIKHWILDGKLHIHTVPTEKALSIKAEWEAAKELFLNECKKLCPSWNVQGWIADKAEWWRIMRLKNVYRDACAMKSQKGRLNKLQKAIESERMNQMNNDSLHEVSKP